MRIATYNTWNSDAGMPIRFRQLADAIIRERADILCLQEVADRENPRWSVVEAKNTVEVNQRVDWIMLKNPYPAGLPQLKACSLFGTDISEETGLAASDHYGVAAELEF